MVLPANPTPKGSSHANMYKTLSFWLFLIYSSFSLFFPRLIIRGYDSRHVSRLTNHNLINFENLTCTTLLSLQSSESALPSQIHDLFHYYPYTHTHIYIYIPIHTCTYVHTHTHIHIYIYTQTYTHIYI